MALTRIVRGRIIVGILGALVTAATVTGCTATLDRPDIRSACRPVTFSLLRL